METQVYPFTAPKQPLFMEKENLEDRAEALKLHYKAHFEQGIAELNRVLEDFPQYQGWMLRQLADNLRMLPEELAFWAGSVYNHWLYFETLAAGKQPGGELEAAIDASFGSFAEWKAQIKRQAERLYGSGWIFVVSDEVGKLKITRTMNCEVPVGYPVLAIDLWEHAYMNGETQNKEAYLDTVFTEIDWGKAGKRYGAAIRRAG